MTFPLTITLAFIGWLYVLFLNNRVLKRSEIARLKDDIIKQLLESNTWIISEIKELSTSSESENISNNDHRKKLEIEQIWAAKMTHIELKSNLLNKLARCQLIDFNSITPLRDIDLTDKPISRTEIIEFTSDIIEKAETAYHDNFFNLNIFEALSTRHKSSVLGAIFGFIILITFYHTMSIFIFNQFIP